MNFDFIDIAKRLDKDKVCLDYLQWHKSDAYGWDTFYLKNKSKLEVKLSKSELKVKANIFYFMNGHNFYNSKKDLIEGLQYVSELLNVNLFNAEAKAFEFGTVININHNPQEFLSNHISINKIPLQPYYKKGTKKLTGKVYEDSIKRIKLYDAGHKVKTTLSKAIRDDLSNFHEYDSTKSYIRIEDHHKQPEAYFKKRNIYVDDILQDGFMKICKENLTNNYKSIMKTGIIQLPKGKDELSTADILLRILMEQAILHGFNPEELWNQMIKALPTELLTKNDKYDRKKQFQKYLKKLKLNEISQYDISEMLAAKEIT